MPASRRAATTDVGRCVPSARYPNVAIANENAIGTPAKTVSGTMPRKKITRLALPSVTSHGRMHGSAWRGNGGALLRELGRSLTHA